MRSVKKKAISMCLVATMILSLSGCGKDKTTIDMTTSEATTIEASTEATTTEAELSEAEIAAAEIIANAESYGGDTKEFSEVEYYENPEIYFLDEEHEDGYEIILKDLDDKTNSSRIQLIDLYKNIDEMFSADDENTKGVFDYYRYMTTDKEKADVYMYENTGKKYASGEEIYGWEVTFYVPYYLRESLYSDKELTLEAVLTELETVDVQDSMFLDIENHSSDYGQFVPYVENMAFFGAVYEEFKGISEHELVYSSPIDVTDYQRYEWFDGAEDCTYLIPFYDQTADIYGLAGYNKDNELVKVEFDYEEATHGEADAEDGEDTESTTSTSANSQSNTTQVTNNSSASNENTAPNNATSTNTTTAPNNTTSNGGSSGQGNGSANVGDDGITFIIVEDVEECKHEYQRVVKKMEDSYVYTDLEQQGYVCWNGCPLEYKDSAEICTYCGEQMSPNWVEVEKVRPALYSVSEQCTKCSSIINNQLLYEGEF